MRLKTSLTADKTGDVKIITVLGVSVTVFVSVIPKLLIPGGEEDVSLSVSV